MESMSTIHMSEAEAALDLHAVLTKVRQGIEIVIEQDRRPVAVLRAKDRSRRPIEEILRVARRRNSTVTLDEQFGRDLDDIVAGSQAPWQPHSWPASK